MNITSPAGNEGTWSMTIDHVTDHVSTGGVVGGLKRPTAHVPTATGKTDVVDHVSRPREACTRCGSTEFVDTPIHNGQSIRRDCARCRRTWGFPRWSGQTEPDAKERARLERVERLLGSTPKITTGAKMFDYAEATAIAKGQHMQTVCITGVTS